VQVLVVRHAIAHERDSKRWPDDSQRPLSPQGVRRFRRAAAGLAKVLPPPERVLSSPFVRALQTAEILTEVANWPAPRKCPELGHGGPIDDVLKLLREYRVKRIAIVGHEPDLGNLIVASVTRAEAGLRFEMKKGGVASLIFSGRPARGRAKLVAYVPPKVLRSIR